MSYRETVEYYHGNKSLPIYERHAKGYSGEEIAMILCDPAFNEDLICSTHPVLVENNVSFVVDLSKLKNPSDIRADDLGTWKCTGSRVLTFAVKCCEKSCRIVDSSYRGAIVVRVRRQYHVHATDKAFHRMIACIENVEKG